MQPQNAPDLSVILGDLSDSVSAHASQQAAMERDRNRLLRCQEFEREALRQRYLRQAQQQEKRHHARFRSGLKGMWDRMFGEHTRIKQLNECEAMQMKKRYQEDCSRLSVLQQSERAEFQDRVLVISRHFQNQACAINRDLSRYGRPAQSELYRIAA